MYYEQDNQSSNPNVWLNIDPLKVKQRIDRIADRIEGVRRKFELLSEVSDSVDGNKK